MAGREIEPERIKKYVKLIAQNASMNEAAKEAGISYSTIMRQIKINDSALNKALGDMGLSEAGVPDRSRWSRDAVRAADDFGYFRERHLARSTSPWAEEAANKILELAETKHKEYVVINCPPGVGKSSLFVHDIPAWLAVRNRALRQMIGSSTQKMANGYTGQLRNTFERTSIVQADPELKAMGLAKDAVSTLVRDYGRFKPADNGLWRREEFVLAQPNGATVTGKEASFVAFGMDTKFLGGRFNIALWDDLVTGSTLKTEESRENLIMLWESEAETRLEPNGLLILQGQRLGPNDLYRYCLNLKDFTEIDAEPEAQPKKYHHIKFKAHYEEQCEGLHEKTDPPYPQGCLLDPYRLTWRDLMRVKTNKEERYQTVYQQEDTDAASSLVQRIWIEGGIDSKGATVPGCWDDERSAGIVPANVKGYSIITADPSPTKYWSIGWWLYDPATQFQYLIDMVRAPMDAPDFLDWNQQSGEFTGLLQSWVLRARDEHRPITHLIVEQNAAQRFMLQYDHFKRWTAINSVRLTSHDTGRNKSDPAFGVQAIAPHYKFGRIRLPGNKLDGSRQSMMPLVKEVTEYPNGTTDDCVMMHWFLVWNAQKLFRPANLDAPTFERPSWIKRSA